MGSGGVGARAHLPQGYGGRGGLKRGVQCRGCLKVETFCKCWCQMDLDTDGTVDLDEFANFFSKRKVDRLLGMRCVRYLMPRSGKASAPRLSWLSLSA